MTAGFASSIVSFNDARWPFCLQAEHLTGKQQTWGVKAFNDFYLNACLGQVGAHGQTLSHDHVRVVSLLESFLQGLQLLGGEGCPTAPLLSVLGAIPGLEDNVLKCAAVEKQET